MSASINPAALPSREALQERLETQRNRVLNAHGIATLAARMASQVENDGDLDADDAVVLRSALDGRCEMLESIKHAVSPETILRTEEVSHD